jgi:uncharacterized membrane protein
MSDCLGDFYILASCKRRTFVGPIDKLAEMIHKIMDKMNSTKLDQFEIENIEDVLPMFEETFKIKLENEQIKRKFRTQNVLVLTMFIVFIAFIIYFKIWVKFYYTLDYYF